ncbi:hypothetical protein WBG78_30375, partial [Chryseolinea sp. T2]|uniref:hypothetical protein n=1 Tax=Chryseolinea sp. T2 TaxID=3129255 RepID=UPI003077C8FF
TSNLPRHRVGQTISGIGGSKRPELSVAASLDNNALQLAATTQCVVIAMPGRSQSIYVTSV